MERRVIIAGGREFTNYTLLKKQLDQYFANTDPKTVQILSGAARGTDRMGEQYAYEKGMTLVKFPANWDEYGKSAGYRRNDEMARNADELVAFWNGFSKGTGHMIQIARNRGLKVTEIRI